MFFNRSLCLFFCKSYKKQNVVNIDNICKFYKNLIAYTSNRENCKYKNKKQNILYIILIHRDTNLN